MSGSPPRASRAFLAAPFVSSIDADTDVMASDDRELLEALMAVLTNSGWAVENAHAREDWGAEWMTAEECTPLDYRDITNADLLIALPGDPPSGGVHIEIGWASASGVPILLLLKEGCEYSQLVLGIESVAEAELLWYRTNRDAVDRLYAHLRAVPAGTRSAS